MTPSENPIKFSFAILLIALILPAPIGIAMLRDLKGVHLGLVISLIFIAFPLGLSVSVLAGNICIGVSLVVSVLPKPKPNKETQIENPNSTT